MTFLKLICLQALILLVNINKSAKCILVDTHSLNYLVNPLLFEKIPPVYNFNISASCQNRLSLSSNYPAAILSDEYHISGTKLLVIKCQVKLTTSPTVHGEFLSFWPVILFYIFLPVIFSDCKKIRGYKPF